MEGAVSAFWPGSALQFHADTSLFLDPGSASRLTMGGFFRRSHANEQELRRKNQL